jgi:hypothetical protein
MNERNNLNIEKDNGVLFLNIKSILKVFWSRKWWFAATFIIVLILSLLFSFSLYKNSNYAVKSELTVSLNNNSYQVMISELYPLESDMLWLNLSEKNIPEYLGYIASGMDNEIFITEVNKSINLSLSNNQLRERIYYNVDDKENVLTITTYSDDIETAKKIKEALINSYNSNMISSFNANYNVLISKVEKKMSEDRLNKNTEEYTALISIQKDLVENKDMYTNRITVTNLPDVARNFFNLRDILMSICVSVFAGAVVLTCVNIIYIKRKNKTL